MKERYLSKTPFLTFVYISKCNINLPSYFGNSKKRFLWTGLVHTYRCNKNVSAIFLCRMPPWSIIKKLKSSNRNLWLSYRYIELWNLWTLLSDSIPFPPLHINIFNPGTIPKLSEVHNTNYIDTPSHVDARVTTDCFRAGQPSFSPSLQGRCQRWKDRSLIFWNVTLF